MHKKERRIKLTDQTSEILDDLIEATGGTASSIINLLLIRYPGISPHAGARLFRKLKGVNSNVVAAPQPATSPHAGKRLIPADFKPDREIAKNAGVDYEQSLQCFIDWAVAGGKKYRDWDATYRNAAKSWLKEKFPHLVRAVPKDRLPDVVPIYSADDCVEPMFGAEDPLGASQPCPPPA